MRAPRWARALLARLAPEGREDEILGDLEEAHRARRARRSRPLAALLTALDTLDMAWALLRRRGFGGNLSWLDFKLGARMLLRYPGLSVLGGLAIAFAILAGAGTYEFLRQVADPTIPFEGGDRWVGIQAFDTRDGKDRDRVLYDLETWRTTLATVDHLGAYTSASRTLRVGGEGIRQLRVAVMQAAGFRLAGTEPLFGRTLVDDDERAGAPLVAVIGYDVWRTAFGSDPDVVGTDVTLGSERVTVVGVMPEEFAFPVAHEVWLPMRVDPGTVAPGEGPRVWVFGRLTEGADLDAAQAELERLDARLATAFPETHGTRRSFVRPYALAMLGLPGRISTGAVSLWAAAWNLPLVLFLLLVAGNVALLMFARAAARESELVVRSALGAGRRRIVGQLFAEALVLAGVGAALGLSLARYGLRWGYHVVELEIWNGPLPFWFRPELSISTMVYAVGLTLLGATVAGVLPALKATRGLADRLRETAAGAGGLRFGGVWTLVIVVQIALTLAFPGVGFAVAMEGRAIRDFDMGIPSREYVTARLALRPPETDLAVLEPATIVGGASAPTDEAQAYALRARRTLAEFDERLRADPRVAGVAWATHAPRHYTGWHQIEVDTETRPSPYGARGHRMGSVAVDPAFFPTLGVTPVAGRDFRTADLGAEPGVVVVNEGFVDFVLGGRNAVGVNVRYVASERVAFEEPGPWYRIIGVVQNLGSMSGYGSAVIYHPADPRALHPAAVVVHVPGDAEAFLPALGALAFDVEPDLTVSGPVRLDRVKDSDVEFYRFWVTMLAITSGVAVVLSLGGIYSVMSFTVARRTREIGVRVALGAPRGRIVLAVFRRPLIQVSVGLLAGAVLTGVLLMDFGSVSAMELAVFSAYVAAMAAVCMLACVSPTRRALSVEPSEALRTE